MAIKPASRAEKELLRILWDFTLPEDVRTHAAAQLAGTGNGDLAFSFVELLKLDRSPAVSRSAIVALGRIATPPSKEMSVVKFLERIARSDRDPALRSEAEIALSRIRKRSEGLHRSSRRASAGKNKRDSLVKSGKDSGEPTGDKSWIIDSELVSQILKGPG